MDSGTAAVLGAVVGGLMVFLSTLFVRRKDQEREKVVLAQGLQAELEGHRESLEKLVDRMGTDIARLGTSTTKYVDHDGIVASVETTYSPPEDLIYLESNLSGLGVLGGSLTSELIRYRHNISTIKRVMAEISDNGTFKLKLGEGRGEISGVGEVHEFAVEQIGKLDEILESLAEITK